MHRADVMAHFAGVWKRAGGAGLPYTIRRKSDVRCDLDVTRCGVRAFRKYVEEGVVPWYVLYIM
jgi:hypothetical protein